MSSLQYMKAVCVQLQPCSAYVLTPWYQSKWSTIDSFTALLPVTCHVLSCLTESCSHLISGCSELVPSWKKFKTKNSITYGSFQHKKNWFLHSVSWDMNPLVLENAQLNCDCLISLIMQVAGFNGRTFSCISYFLGYPLNFDLQRSALDPKLVVDTDAPFKHTSSLQCMKAVCVQLQTLLVIFSIDTDAVLPKPGDLLLIVVQLHHP